MKIWVCVLIAAALLILGAWACEDTSSDIYPMTMVVTEVDLYEDLVTLRDYCGFEWQFWGTDDWQPGDICSCIMNTEGTASIFDDSIVDVRYSGVMNNWEEWGQ